MDDAIPEITGAGVAAAGTYKALQFFERLLGPAVDELGGALGDKVAGWRARNRIRIAGKAKVILENRGGRAQPTPASFVVPMIEAIGMSDDEALDEMWANLLASGVTNESSRNPAYLTVLRQLTAHEAKLLEDTAEGRAFDEPRHHIKKHFMIFEEEERDPEAEAREERLASAQAKLIHIGLIATDGRQLTRFGWDFLSAVRETPLVGVPPRVVQDDRQRDDGRVQAAIDAALAKDRKLREKQEEETARDIERKIRNALSRVR